MFATPLPPVPAIVTDDAAVALLAQVMTPPVLPMPMLIAVASRVLLAEPRLNVDVPASLSDWELPMSISVALMKLAGAMDPAVVFASVNVPLLSSPSPTAKVPVVLTLTLFSPDRLAVVESFPPVLGCPTLKSSCPVTASDPPPVTVSAPL